MLYTAQQLKQQWQASWNTFRKRVQYHVMQEKLFPLAHGVYSTKPEQQLDDGDFLYLGWLLYTPAYRSFETVLYKAWIVFQFTSSIVYAWPYSKEKQIAWQRFIYKRMPFSLLTWNVGLITTDTGIEATPERALCDLLYRNAHYPLDGLPQTIDHTLLLRIATKYSMIKWQKHLPDRILALGASYEKKPKRSP